MYVTPARGFYVCMENFVHESHAGHAEYPTVYNVVEMEYIQRVSDDDICWLGYSQAFLYHIHVPYSEGNLFKTKRQR